MSRPILQLSALKIAGIYMAISVLWILSTDQIAMGLFGDLYDATIFQTAKGLLFVFTTGFMIYLLINRNNKQLEEEQQLLKQAEEIAGLGTWSYDLKTGEIKWSDQVYELLGFDPKTTPPTWTFDDILGFLVPESRKKLHRAIDRLIEEGASYRIDLELKNSGAQKKYVQDVGRPLTDTDGNVYRIIGTVMDITERKLTELEVLKSRRRYKQAERIARLGNWQRNLETGDIEWSPQIFEIFGLDPDTFEVTFENFIELVDEADRQKLIRSEEQAIENDGEVQVEYRLNRPDGQKVHLMERGEIIRNPVSSQRIFTGIVMDVTELKKTEGQLKQSLKEKDILIQEIHHRVKNNLAVIASLMELQEDQMESVDGKAALQICKLRIHSIAKIHEKLYQTEQLSHINLEEYIPEIGRIIQAQYDEISNGVELDISVEPITININQAIPCGLILNELLNNAYQHAFKGTGGGSIAIGCRTIADDRIEIFVSDDGKGVQEEVNVDQPQSLGLNLVKSLTQQLNGELQIDNEEGFHVAIQFARES